MIQRGDGLGFALETGPERRIGREYGRQDLQRDRAVQLCVFGGIDFSHAAGPERVDDAVVAERVARVHERGILSQLP
jgi:hypothetical protein